MSGKQGERIGGGGDVFLSWSMQVFGSGGFVATAMCQGWVGRGGTGEDELLEKLGRF